MPATAARRPAAVPVTIAACAALALALRVYQLSRPGFLLGVTEYDDGVLFGNALRLVSGVIPYRDFAMVQPPGSALLMVPVALLAKVTGTAWGLAIARILTVWAVVPLVLVGVLVAVTARDARPSQPLTPRAPAPRTSLRPTLAARARPVRMLAGGAALGLGVPLLPFAVLAPGSLARGVLVGQLVRNASGGRDLTGRLAELAGLVALPARFPRPLLLAAIGAAIAGLYAAAYFAARCRPAALDAYALLGAVAVTGMLLWPRLYYSHYGAFDGPFLALAVALPAGRLAVGVGQRRWVVRHTRVCSLTHYLALPSVALATVLGIVVVGAAIVQFRAESGARGIQVAAAADRLIPAGACVVTNDSAFTVAVARFYSSDPGCPAMTDSFGTLIAMTSGHPRDASTAVLAPVVALWQATLARAGYVWLTSSTVAQIPWNRQLDGYFLSHFRLIGFAGPPTGWRYVPQPGLYVRR